MILNEIRKTSDILSTYNLPKSTFYDIKRNRNKECIQMNSKNDIYQDLFGVNLKELECINKIVKPPTTPNSIKRITDNINSIYEWNTKQQNVRNYLKKIINYSYKKGSSTTLKGASFKIRNQQSILSWRILNEILDNKYIVNIDESSF